MSLLEQAFDDGYEELEWVSLDGPDVDWWAIKVCVRELRHMNLNRVERVICVRLMRRKGVGFEDIANILKQDPDVTRGMMRKDRHGINVDAIIEEFPGIIGDPVPDNKPPLTPKEMKRLVGGS